MNEYNKRETGKRIRKLRDEKDFTREQLAERADISGNFLWEVESGRKIPSAKRLFGIAQGLGVSMDFLVTGEDTNEDFRSIISILKGCTPRQLRIIESIISSTLEMREP